MILSQIGFFIDPSSGQAFTHNDVENYFKRIAMPPSPDYFKPVPNKVVIRRLLEEFSNCFTADKDTYKKTGLLELASLLD